MLPDDLPDEACVALDEMIAQAHKDTHVSVNTLRCAIHGMLPMLDAEKVLALPARVAAEMLVHGALEVISKVKQ